MSQKMRWYLVAAFAVAMAWLESATVYYLRILCDRMVPYQTDPLPRIAGLAQVELVREAATLFMLLAVGMLAGRTWRSRLGYGAIAFGFWDLGYYVFLKLITAWPRSLTDWDLLFLIPLPWWGPVIAPALIAVMMIVWGTLVSQWEHHYEWPLRSEWKVWTVNFLGMGLALYVFMEDALKAAPGGETVVRQMLPKQFHWSLFLCALALMAAPILHNLRRIRQRVVAVA